MPLQEGAAAPSYFSTLATRESAMKISHNGPSLTCDPSTSPGTADVNQDDMCAFSTALNAPSSDNQKSMLSGLGDAIRDNQRAQQQAFRDLEIASRSSNPMDISQANTTLSDYYIKSLMNAKIIAKGTQALDKLTNLQ